MGCELKTIGKKSARKQKVEKELGGSRWFFLCFFLPQDAPVPGFL